LRHSFYISREKDDSRKSDKKKLLNQEESKQKQKKKVILSFEDDLADEDKEDVEPALKKKRNIGKNPTVDTSFLPDEQRKMELISLKLKLSEEFLREQERIKG